MASIAAEGNSTVAKLSDTKYQNLDVTSAAHVNRCICRSIGPRIQGNSPNESISFKSISFINFSGGL